MNGDLLAPVDGHEPGDAALHEGFVDDVSLVQSGLRKRIRAVVDHYRDRQQILALPPLLSLIGTPSRIPANLMGVGAAVGESVAVGVGVGVVGGAVGRSAPEAG